MADSNDPTLDETARKAAKVKRQAVLSGLGTPLLDITNDLLDGRTHACEHLHVLEEREGGALSISQVLDEGAYLVHLGHIGEHELYYWRSRDDETRWGYGFAHYQKSDEATRTFIVKRKSPSELALEYGVNALMPALRVLDDVRTRILMDLPND